MTHDAAQDGAIARLRSWRPRRPVEPPADPPAVCPYSRAPEISALLADLDTLRLGLSTDLGMAASAVEAGVYDVARDVVDGGRHDLAAFAARAERHLRVPEADVGDAGLVLPLAPRRRGRRLAVLGPALTAAAAVVGLLTGVVPNDSGSAGPRPSVMSEAAASYAELWRLHEQGAPPAQLREVARQLHAEMARLVAVASADPATAAQALRLLELEVRVLGDPQHGGALDAELAESQRLVAALRRAALAAGAGDLLTSLPQPDELPSVPLPQAVPEAAPEAAPSAPEPRRDDTGPAGTAVAPPAQAPALKPPALTPTAAKRSPEPAASSEPEPEPMATPASPPPGSWFPTSGTGSVLPG